MNRIRLAVSGVVAGILTEWPEMKKQFLRIPSLFDRVSEHYTPPVEYLPEQ